MTSESCPGPERFERILNDEYESPQERERWEAHLAGCESCRELLDLERALRQTFSAVPAPELSEGFSRRLENGLAAQRRHRRSSRVRRLVLQGYWAAALVASGLILERLGGVSHVLAEAGNVVLPATVLTLAGVVFLASRLRLDVPALVWRTVLDPRL